MKIPCVNGECTDKERLGICGSRFNTSEVWDKRAHSWLRLPTWSLRTVSSSHEVRSSGKQLKTSDTTYKTGQISKMKHRSLCLAKAIVVYRYFVSVG